MSLDTISTAGAPKAIGPYSQAISANGFLFTAGQVALDPATGELVTGGIAEQTTRALENLRAVLKAAGSGLDQVVKTTVFLVDMADFSEMNEVYGRVFGAHRPARSTVAVAALPKGARVEIEVVATVREVRGER
jgi:2-iminobutanoate/2-iminopropanoate deaminase